MDLAITATSVVKVTGTPRLYTLGETVTAGQAVYQKSSDSKIYKADNNVTSAEATLKGVAMNGGAADQAVAVMEAVGDVIDAGATLTVGETYVVSATAGGIAPIGDLLTGNYVSVVGVATASNRLRLILNNTGVQKA